jgi:hypothetical protein
MLGRVHVRKFAKNQQTPNTASLSPTRTTLPRILHCCAVQEAKYIESDKAHTLQQVQPAQWRRAILGICPNTS